MATPHINAEKGDFAKVVLMPGDPLRAKWIAENFLVDAKMVTYTRAQLGYTGKTKNGKTISVMSSGMGMPSIAIYANELYTHFGVETIIRIGTMGSYQKDVPVRDLVIAQAASTDTQLPNFAGIFAPCSDYLVDAALYRAATARNIPVHIGNVLSANVFYDLDPNTWKAWAYFNVLGVEMESYALFMLAQKQRKKAAGIFTVTDSFPTDEHLSADERQTGLKNMVETAIEAAEQFAE